MTKIGIQISSLRQFLQTPEDVLESFKKVSKIGYRIVQIQWIAPEVPMEFINDALKETGLRCIGTQDLYDEVIPNLDRIIQMNDLWGGSSICVSGIPKRYHSLGGCIEFARGLQDIAEALKDAGKVLVFHPRCSDILNFEGRDSLDIILENTGDNFQIGLDIYHIIKAGYDPVQWIHKLKGRMDWVHFKDKAFDPSGQEILVPVGQGVTEWDDIIEACLETGIKYVFAEQESWQKDPFECLEDAFKFITTKGIH